MIIKAFYTKEKRRCDKCGRVTDKGFEVREGDCLGFFCSRACYDAARADMGLEK